MCLVLEFMEFLECSDFLELGDCVFNFGFFGFLEVGDGVFSFGFFGVEIVT